MTSPSEAPGTLVERDASLHAGVLAGRDVVRAEREGQIPRGDPPVFKGVCH